MVVTRLHIYLQNTLHTAVHDDFPKQGCEIHSFSPLIRGRDMNQHDHTRISLFRIAWLQISLVLTYQGDLEC